VLTRSSSEVAPARLDRSFTGSVSSAVPVIRHNPEEEDSGFRPVVWARLRRPTLFFKGDSCEVKRVGIMSGRVDGGKQIVG